MQHTYFTLFTLLLIKNKHIFFWKLKIAHGTWDKIKQNKRKQKKKRKLYIILQFWFPNWLTYDKALDQKINCRDRKIILNPNKGHLFETMWGSCSMRKLWVNCTAKNLLQPKKKKALPSEWHENDSIKLNTGTLFYDSCYTYV